MQKTSSSAERQQSWKARQRAHGLKRVELWLSPTERKLVEAYLKRIRGFRGE